MMRPRRVAVVAVLCGTAALAGGGAARLAGFGSPGFENTARASIDDRLATSVLAKTMAAPQATAMRKGDLSVADVATDADPSESDVALAALPVTDAALVEAALPDSSPMLPPEAPPAQMATATTPDPVQIQSDTREPASSIETLDECLVADICIDRYLWSLYQRTPKVDTTKVVEKIKVTVEKNGKTRTVTKELTKYVAQDFTWKDPKAAEKAGMPLMDYVIGGMDRSFKLKLFHALRALDDAGLAPGITSGFRDDFRQSIATGLKAASDRSYHGGSSRGGYGHGLAADVVSVKGETRSQRFRSSEELWKWIDEHGKDYGVGRPYLDKDPPHVVPIDSREYVYKRGHEKAQQAALEAKKNRRVAVGDSASTTSRAKTAKSSKVRSTEPIARTRPKTAAASVRPFSVSSSPTRVIE